MYATYAWVQLCLHTSELPVTHREVYQHAGKRVSSFANAWLHD